MFKILIVQPAFIGDVVLATALAEKLHRHYPDATIDFLVRKGNESLLTDHPFIKKVFVWDKKRQKTINLLKLSLQIRNEKYYLLINLQRYFSSGMLTVLSGAEQTRGFDKNPLSAFFNVKIPHIIKANGTLHEIDRNQLLIEDLTDSFAEKPRLYPSEIDFTKVAAYKSRPYITIAPNSVWFTKQYPHQHWETFLNLVPPHLHIFLLGAPSDFENCELIIRNSKNQNCINLCGKLNFLQSAALMKDATMNYVNDSAPLHFASAMNAPTTAIFCSTVPEFGFGPLSDIQTIIQTTENLSCKPCGLHGYKSCPEKHFKCALTIAPETLASTINERRN
ncbi:glycosyltransferase family 9 protein [Daejeonella oryzae]|uniref:glycosyltransferase family 9 protein n=1 Tax=Daejeonella oryzae TaxID=1122943 RepID=UPI00041EEE0C|nr:glycosyltransferase family 9 protein [Daejeonella oryzae]